MDGNTGNDEARLAKLVEDVERLADPIEREAVIMGTERGSGYIKIPFASATIVRDEFGRIASLVGPEITRTLIRDENGRMTGYYEEREEIVPE